MSKRAPRIRRNRNFTVLAIAALLACFVAQAQASVASGLARITGACASEAVPHKGMKHPGCCGPNCCCDVQQDNTPAVPDSAAVPTAPAGTEEESLLSFVKPQSGALEVSGTHLQHGMVRYLRAGPVYLSPLNLLC